MGGFEKECWWSKLPELACNICNNDQRRPSWKARKLCWWSGRRPMYEVPRGEVF